MKTTVLTGEQIGIIDAASIRILERTGVLIPHEETRDRLRERGAKVDGERVYIPEPTVRWAVESAGKTFTIFGRDPSMRADFGTGARNYNSIAGEALWADTPGADRRYAEFSDVSTAARVGDALRHINIVGAMTDPRDVPEQVRCIEVFTELIRNTVKPVTFWFHDRASAKYIVELCIALRGSEEKAKATPPCYPFLEPISPLRFPKNGIDLLYETARIGLPVPIGPMAQSGVSAPMSLPGTMAVENAEILAGVCVTQVIRPGTPVCYGGICHAFDMRTTQLIFSGPEQAVFGIAMTQLGKSYGFPVYVNTGLTDSKRPDAQAGAEIGITLAGSIAAGADIFGHMGISGVDQASSLEMLILQDEIIGYIESSMRGMDFSEEAMGISLVEELGPGGSFLQTDHTAERFREELWFPRLFDRQFYGAWRDSGAEDTEARCIAEKERILSEHTVPPPDAGLDREFDRIITAARRELLP